VLIVAVVFAVLGAASNAAGTAFQRLAASTVTRGGGLRLILALSRKPAWLAGIAGVMGAALFQALALTFGPLALVQPLFILELPFALLIAAPLLHRRLPTMGWYGVGAVVLGLALALGSAAPSGSTTQAPMDRWTPALAVCVGLIAAAVLMAARSKSSLVRAATLGAAAAIGNALTAALLKSATGTFSDHGPKAFLTTWQTYGFAITGIAAVLLLENALQAGSLAASQPALTIGDATVSLLLGVTLFGETIRLGWFVIPELAGVAMITGGVLALTRAVPHIRDVAAQPPAPGTTGGDGR
jgi:drug/metabolite transporter (DMT)-like permease